ncbi:MAG: manganese efflux pump [Candidatus Methanomethylophilaceae archaeon]|nr:manganese efflux pump [Candidatus Methanomethylophilaceae archaeon]
MSLDLVFLLNSLLLGAGLAMDAFAVSVANGVQDPKMGRGRVLLIAGTFAMFQALMPLIGWLCVNTVAEQFSVFGKVVPYISLILLTIIGLKMIAGGISGNEEAALVTGLGTLMIQGVATSIDALSVGFTIAEYDALSAIICASIIAAVTMVLCILALKLGNRIGSRFSDKATILGGIILIFIGAEIFVTGVLL